MRYELTDAGPVPLDVNYVREYLKCPSTLDDEYISNLIRMATQYGETFTGRDLRASTWTLWLDVFPLRIVLRRSPVASVTSVNRMVSSVLTPVTSADYYLKKSIRYSEVLLDSTGSGAWPDDVDDNEDSVNVIFVTEAYPNASVYQTAMLKHIAFAYENRGDTPIPVTGNSDRASGGMLGYEGALASGAIGLYQQIRIPRI